MNQHIKSYKLRKISKTVASVAFGVFMSASFAFASPTGGQIISGSGSISQTGNTTTISQNSGVLDISWDTFNINSNETVNFDQVNSSAIAINRIQDINPSQINGTLTANGRVFLINNAGITFGAGAHVNVGSLVATTSDLTDFNGDEFTFSGGENNSKVQNFGNINIADGGFAVLSAPHVVNQGSINAKGGLIALGSATEFSLNIAGHNVNFLGNNATAGIIGVDTAGNLSAQGGAIVIKAKQAADLAATMINLDGNINVSAYEASGTVGSIDIFSEGNLDAKSSLLAQANAHTTGNGGNALFIAEKTAVFRDGAQIEIKGGHLSGKGGFTEFSGYERLHVLGSGFDASGANGVGVVLFDPQDITVAAGGGAAYSDVDLFSDNAGLDMTIDAATITAINADIVLEATQDIFINQDIDHSANAGRSITLNAGRHITMQAGTTITTNSGNINFSADHDFSGGGGNASDGVGDITVASLSSQGGNINITNTDGNITFLGSENVLSAAGDINVNKYSGVIEVKDNARLDSGNGNLTLDITPQSGDPSTLTTADQIFVNYSGVVRGYDVILRAGQIRDTNTGYSINFSATNSMTMRGESYGQRKGTVDGLRTYTLTTQTPILNFENQYGNLYLRNYGDLVLNTNYSGAGSSALGTLQVIGSLTYNGQIDDTSGNRTDIYVRDHMTFGAGSFIHHGAFGGQLSIQTDMDDNGTGNIYMASDSSIKTQTNALMFAADRIELALVIGGNFNYGFKSGNPMPGIVVDANGSAINVQGNVITSGSFVTLDPGEFGTALDPIETQVAGIDTQISSHSMYIDEVDDMNIYFSRDDNGAADLHINAGGDIITQSDLTKTTGSLQLNTAQDLIINHNITTGSALNLNAGRHITMGVGSSITTNGNNLTLSADHDFSGGGGNASDGVGDITVASLSSQGGDINISNTDGNITFLGSENILSAAGDINVNKYSGVIEVKDNARLDSGNGNLTLDITPQSGDLSTLTTADQIFVNDSGVVRGYDVILRAGQIRDANSGSTINFTATNNLTLRGETVALRKAGIDSLFIQGLNTQTPNLTFENEYNLNNTNISIRNYDALNITIDSANAGNGIHYIQTVGGSGDITFNGNLSSNAVETNLQARGDVNFAAGSSIRLTNTTSDLFIAADRDRNGSGNIIMASDVYLRTPDFMSFDAYERIELAHVEANYFNPKVRTLVVADRKLVDVNGDNINIDATHIGNGFNAADMFPLQFGNSTNAIETNTTTYVTLAQSSVNAQDVYINEVDDISFNNNRDSATTNISISAGGDITSTNPINKTTGNVTLIKTGGDWNATPDITTTSGNINLGSTTGALNATGAVNTTSGNVDLNASTALSLAGGLAISTTGNANLTATDITFGAGASVDADKVVLKAGTIALGDVTAQSADDDALTIEDATTITDADDNSAHLIGTNGGIVFKNVNATDVDIHIDSAKATLDTVSGDMALKNEKNFDFAASTLDGNLVLTTVSGTAITFESAAAQAIRDAITIATNSNISLNGTSLTMAPPPPPSAENNSGDSAAKDTIKKVVNQVQRADEAANAQKGAIEFEPTDKGFTPDTPQPSNTTTNQVGDVDVVKSDDKIYIGSIEIEVTTENEANNGSTTEVNTGDVFETKSASANESSANKEKSQTQTTETDELKKLLLDFIPDKVLNLADLTAYLEQAQRKKL